MTHYEKQRETHLWPGNKSNKRPVPWGCLDMKLKQLFDHGAKIDEMVNELGKTPAQIKTRLTKLGYSTKGLGIRL